MKLLATSDFQLGAGADFAQDRLAEQAAMLARIAAIASDEQAHAVILAGDVYENRRPSREEDEVFADWLADLQERGIPVLANLGNHDWRGFERTSTVRLFRRLGLQLFEHPDVTVLSELQPVVAVAFLPWIAPGHLAAARNGSERQAIHEEETRLLLKTAEGLKADCEHIAEGLPAILVTHWWLEGAGKVDAAHLAEPILPIADLTDLGFAAVIGGHVHDAALLNEAPPVVMCGSPYVCNWGEAGDAHGVWLLDVAEETQVRFVPVEDHPFITIDCEPGDGDGGILWPEEWDGAYEGAVIRLCYQATAEQARRIDAAAIRAALHAAGAARVFIQPTIVREDRARVEGVDETLGPLEALRLYCEHQSINGDRAGAMAERTSRYLSEVS